MIACILCLIIHITARRSKREEDVCSTNECARDTQSGTGKSSFCFLFSRKLFCLLASAFISLHGVLGMQKLLHKHLFIALLLFLVPVPLPNPPPFIRGQYGQSFINGHLFIKATCLYWPCITRFHSV